MLPAVLGIGIISLIIYLVTPSTDQFSSVSLGDAVTLSLGAGNEVTCYFNSLLYTTYSDGTKSLITKPYTITLFDLLNRQTGKKIISFDHDLNISCGAIHDSTGKDTGKVLYLKGGLLDNTVTAYDYDGREKIIYSKDTEVPSIKRIVSKNTITLPQAIVSKADIESALSAGNGDYQTWVKILTNGYVIFEDPDGSTRSRTLPQNALYIGYLINVQKPLPTSQQSAPLASNVVIKSVEPKTIDFGVTTRQSLKVVGQLDNWVSTEGLPILEIYDSQNKLFSRLNMGSYSNTDADKWTEFTVSYIFNKDNTPVGSYTLKMTSALGSDGKPIRKASGYPIVATNGFVIVNNALPTVKILTPTSTTTPTSTSGSIVGSGKIKFDYDARYFGGRSQGTIPEDGFATSIKSLSLTGQVIGESLPLQTIVVNTIFIPDSELVKKMYIATTDIKHFASIIAEGKTIQLLSTDITSTPNKTRDSTGTFSLTKTSIIADTIEKKLLANGIAPAPDAKEVILRLDVNGSFTLYDLQNKQYKGVIDGAYLSFPLSLISAVSPPAEPEKCQGLTGQALLDCKGIQVPTDPCTGLTPEQCGTAGQECFDLFGYKILCSPPQKQCISSDPDVTCQPTVVSRTGSQPNAVSGVSGICQDYQTTVECIDAIKNNLVPPINIFNPELSNQLFIIGVIIVIILMVAIAIRIVRSRR